MTTTPRTTTKHSATTHSTTTNNTASPIERLQREWTQLNRRPSTLARVDMWELRSFPYRSLDELLADVGYWGDTTDDVADHLLWRLVKIARTDDLAARIVLQRILPPVMAIIRRRYRVENQPINDVATTVISHAWEVIRTYPYERRPRKVASNLVRDTEYHAFVRPRRRPHPLDNTVPLTEHSHPVATPSTHPAIELRGVIADARHDGLSDRSHAIISELAHDANTAVVAARLNVSPRTARVWRRDALNELRALTRSAG
jgi:hypothetical protein